jgi:23S rRNA pseudouridine955/2504/2580 synthase
VSRLRTKVDPAVALAATDGGRPSVRHIAIDPDDAGQRLDNFLVRLCRDVPKSHLYRLIRSGQLRVNGGRQEADYRLRAGDSIRLPPLRVAGGAAAGTSTAAPVRAPGAALRAGDDPVRRARAGLARRLPILHEDDWLLAIDKPAAVAVHGGSGVSSGVIEQLRAARPQARFLELVHRLDRETSGVLLVARKRAALVALHAQLRERGTDKRYLAIVAGRWPLRTRVLAYPLQRRDAPDGDRRVAVQAGGQEAITRVTGLARFELPGLGEFSLVEARLETGRTHQIRVHLAHAGCPVAGDPKYGRFDLNRELARRGFRRMYLHAHSIAFRHPDDGRLLRIEAPMPAAFDALLQAGGAAQGRAQA